VYADALAGGDDEADGVVIGADVGAGERGGVSSAVVHAVRADSTATAPAARRRTPMH
jgi:hypothetical protein